MWRLTRLQRRGIPAQPSSNFRTGDSTGGWQPLLVTAIPMMNFCVGERPGRPFTLRLLT